MNCWIFDVDGTLSNPSHRKHHLQGKPKRWDLWNSSMAHDTPHDDIIEFTRIAKLLGIAVVISTGREEAHRQVTLDWLVAHNASFDRIYMRKTKDYRHDVIVKKEMLDQMRIDGYTPSLVFDDRNSVVDMWRENNIRCLHVAPGDF